MVVRFKMRFPAVLVILAITLLGCGETQPEPEVTSPTGTTTERNGIDQGPVIADDGAPDTQRFRSVDEIPRVTVAELQDLIAQDAVQIVDVRTANAFITEHIPGSVNIPGNEITSRMDELDRERTIVTYCT